MIKIELLEQEIESLAGLLDAGVKAVGLRAVKDATVLLTKIEEAVYTQKEKEDINNGHE